MYVACINIATWLLFEHYNKLYSFESQDVLVYVYVRLQNNVKLYWLCASTQVHISVCVCMSIYIYTYTYIYIPTYILTYLYTYTYTYTFTHLYMYTGTT